MNVNSFCNDRRHRSEYPKKPRVNFFSYIINNYFVPESNSSSVWIIAQQNTVQPFQYFFNVEDLACVLLALLENLQVHGKGSVRWFLAQYTVPSLRKLEMVNEEFMFVKNFVGRNLTTCALRVRDSGVVWVLNVTRMVVSAYQVYHEVSAPYKRSHVLYNHDHQQTRQTPRMEAATTSLTQVAAYLGVKAQTVYAYVSRGLLTPVRRGGPGGSLFDATAVQALRDGLARPARRSAAVPVEVRTQITQIRGDRLAYRGRDVVD